MPWRVSQVTRGSAVAWSLPGSPRAAPPTSGLLSFAPLCRARAPRPHAEAPDPSSGPARVHGWPQAPLLKLLLVLQRRPATDRTISMGLILTPHPPSCPQIHRSKFETLTLNNCPSSVLEGAISTSSPSTMRQRLLCLLSLRRIFETASGTCG